MRYLLLILIFYSINAFGQSIQEQLGYPKGTKLLILHADDIGVSHSENAATIEAFGKGMVISGSVMVPCPWFLEIAKWSVENPSVDLGLHLTLTSEWDDYKWGPVAPKELVPTLVNRQGFFHSGRDSLARIAKPSEVDLEVRAQIDRSIAMGMDPTHLDPHMFLLFQRPEFLEVLIKAGNDYRLPILLSKGMQERYSDDNELIKNYPITVDAVYGAGPEDYKKGLSVYYSDVLKNMEPGLNYLLIHTAYDNPEMQAITRNYEDWGAKWRQDDFGFFTSEECRQILEEENIQLITWREIRDKLIRNTAAK